MAEELPPIKTHEVNKLPPEQQVAADHRPDRNATPPLPVSITQEEIKQFTHSASPEQIKKRDEFLKSLGPEGKELIAEFNALHRTVEQEAKSGKISDSTMNKLEEMAKKAGTLALDPDKNGTADPEHVKQVVDLFYPKKQDPKSIAAAMEAIDHPNNPFGRTLIPAGIMDHMNKALPATGVKAIEKGLGLQVPPESAQILADSLTAPLNEMVIAGNKKFLDRGDANHGNAGKGDGVLTAEEMRPAIYALHEQGAKLTVEELKRTIERTGLKASPELVNAAIGYQEYLGKESQKAATAFERLPEKTQQAINYAVDKEAAKQQEEGLPPIPKKGMDLLRENIANMPQIHDQLIRDHEEAEKLNKYIIEKMKNGNRSHDLEASAGQHFPDGTNLTPSSAAIAGKPRSIA